MVRPGIFTLALIVGAVSSCSGNAGGDPSTPTQAPLVAGILSHGELTSLGGRELLGLLDNDVLRALRAAQQPTDEFWRPDPAAEVARAEAIRIAEHAARSALTEAFGTAVVDSPAFWQLFKPLHDRMPELGSAQQIAVHDLERRLLAAGPATESRLTFAEHLAEVRRLLGDELAIEYALRASPIAAELRNAGIDLSETEFRNAFGLLTDMNGATEGMAIVETRRRLRQQLGSRRFARLWSRRDPRFAQLVSAARRFELEDDIIITAYADLMDNQDLMIATALNTAEQTLSEERLRTLHDAGRRRLTDIVGIPAADALMRAFTRRPATPNED